MRVGLRHGKQRAGEARKTNKKTKGQITGSLGSGSPSFPIANAKCQPHHHSRDLVTSAETPSHPRQATPHTKKITRRPLPPETKPPPLTTARAPVFSKPFFRGWIVVVYLWAFFAAITITCYPVWEGRASIARFFRYATGRSPVVAQSTSNPSSVIEGVFVRGHESEDVRYESEVPAKIG